MQITKYRFDYKKLSESAPKRKRAKAVSKKRIKEFMGTEVGAVDPMADVPGSIVTQYEKAQIALFKYAKTKIHTPVRAKAVVDDALRIMDMMLDTGYGMALQNSLMKYINRFFDRYV